MQNPLKNIPSVHELLESEPLKKLVDNVSHNVVVTEVRSFLDNLRDDIREATTDVKMPAPAELAERIANWIVTDQQPKLRPVINATGILLHTGLGRAPLADAAIAAINQVASGYSSVEVDLESGHRSQRVQSVTKLLCEATGAEAAAVANNNAGATMLALAALGAGKEVIVSRGHLVEIGGSYRLPDVMTVSGATLREVGTTNKTRISDYEEAIGEQTGALMRVHTSNYVIKGFTQEAALSELIAVGGQHGLPVIDDIGSGALVDFSKYGIEGEPMAADSIKAGSDVVLFSGDKLLGGPQCGIIVGKRKHVDRITKHPMMRALRVDKITLAALAATLKLYRDTEVAEKEIPLLSLLSTSSDNLKSRAERLAPQLAALPTIESADVLPGEAFLGGGSVPTQRVASWCTVVKPANDSIDAFARALRTGSQPVFPRVQQDRIWFDLRTIFPNQDAAIVAACGVRKTRSKFFSRYTCRSPPKEGLHFNQNAALCSDAETCATRTLHRWFSKLNKLPQCRAISVLSGKGSERWRFTESTDWVAGLTGQAIELDNENERVRVRSSSTWASRQEDFTMSTWVKFDDLSDANYKSIASVGSWDDQRLNIYPTDGRLNLKAKSSDWRTSVLSTPLSFLQSPDNRFHHIVAVKDSATHSASLYVDGALVGRDDYSSGSVDLRGWDLSLCADSTGAQQIAPTLVLREPAR